MRILVTGASGYLGRYVLAEAASRTEAVGTFRSNPRPRSARAVQTPRGHALSPPSSQSSPPSSGAGARTLRLDLLKMGDFERLVREVEPTAIVHTAAANPGTPPEDFEPVNHLGSATVARVAATVGARLVHVSTDVVHDGRSAPYADDAATHPLSDYGHSKARAEQAVLAAYPAAAVVRTSLIYGLDEIDSGTAGFAARLQAGEPVRLFNDVIRQPVHVKTLAQALIALALDHPMASGTINVAGSQALTREEFGRRMLQFWDVPGREQVESIAAQELSDSIPLDLRLRHDRALTLGLPLRSVDEILSS